jgi:hypothetical protein
MNTNNETSGSVKPEEVGSGVTRNPRPALNYPGMEPRKNPRQPIFRDHNCGGCDSGARPCREGNYNSCSWPRARND